MRHKPQCHTKIAHLDRILADHDLKKEKQCLAAWDDQLNGRLHAIEDTRTILFQTPHDLYPFLKRAGVWPTTGDNESVIQYRTGYSAQLRAIQHYLRIFG